MVSGCHKLMLAASVLLMAPFVPVVAAWEALLASFVTGLVHLSTDLREGSCAGSILWRLKALASQTNPIVLSRAQQSASAFRTSGGLRLLLICTAVAIPWKLLTILVKNGRGICVLQYVELS